MSSRLARRPPSAELVLPGGRAIPLAFVSDFEAEAADVVVCARYREGDEPVLQDNAYDLCSVCGHRVQLRPDAPVSPPRICVECLGRKIAN